MVAKFTLHFHPTKVVPLFHRKGKNLKIPLNGTSFLWINFGRRSHGQKMMFTCSRLTIWLRKVNSAPSISSVCLRLLIESKQDLILACCFLSLTHQDISPGLIRIHLLSPKSAHWIKSRLLEILSIDKNSSHCLLTVGSFSARYFIHPCQRKFFCF